jgi:hypothetical protein
LVKGRERMRGEEEDEDAAAVVVVAEDEDEEEEEEEEEKGGGRGVREIRSAARTMGSMKNRMG